MGEFEGRAKARERMWRRRKIKKYVLIIHEAIQQKYLRLQERLISQGQRGGLLLTRLQSKVRVPHVTLPIPCAWCKYITSDSEGLRRGRVHPAGLPFWEFD